MKFLSDVYTSVSGKPFVEWEFSDGGRFREEFQSEEERDLAINKNQQWLDEHKDEVDVHLKAEEEWLAEQEAQYIKEWENQRV